MGLIIRDARELLDELIEQVSGLAPEVLAFAQVLGTSQDEGEAVVGVGQLLAVTRPGGKVGDQLLEQIAGQLMCSAGFLPLASVGQEDAQVDVGDGEFELEYRVEAEVGAQSGQESNGLA